jgi:hypothetical protein
VEKVVMHEDDEGKPHHALVVFKHAESVMYSISVFNGYPLEDQPLSMRPLRESSHAAVFQRAAPSRVFPMGSRENNTAAPKSPSESVEEDDKEGTLRHIYKRDACAVMGKKEDAEGEDRENMMTWRSAESVPRHRPPPFGVPAQNHGFNHLGGQYGSGMWPGGLVPAGMWRVGPTGFVMGGEGMVSRPGGGGSGVSPEMMRNFVHPPPSFPPSY